jgi:hypothetical protein
MKRWSQNNGTPLTSIVNGVFVQLGAIKLEGLIPSAMLALCVLCSLFKFIAGRKMKVKNDFVKIKPGFEHWGGSAGCGFENG